MICCDGAAVVMMICESGKAPSARATPGATTALAAAIAATMSAPRMPAPLNEAQRRQQGDRAEAREIEWPGGAARAAARTALLARVTGVVGGAVAAAGPIRAAAPIRAAGRASARTAGGGAPGTDHARVAAARAAGGTARTDHARVAAARTAAAGTSARAT